MITMQDELDARERLGRIMSWLLVVAMVVGVILGVIKVKNELAMTRAYDRQAAALERIADAVERAHPAPITERGHGFTCVEAR